MQEAFMNKFVIAPYALTLMVTLISGFAFGGGANGGGGHPCKLDFTEKYETLKSFVTPEVVKKYPWIVDTILLLDKKSENPLTISVVDKPITDCPNTSSAFLCSRVPERKIEVYCDEKGKGWKTIKTPEAYKHILHELLWWNRAGINDKNYSSSREVINYISRLQSMESKTLTCGIDGLEEGIPHGFEAKYIADRKLLDIHEDIQVSGRSLKFAVDYSKTINLKSAQKELMWIDLRDVTPGGRPDDKIMLTTETTYIDLESRLDHFPSVRVSCKVNNRVD
jgi:hypothetical protein